MKALIEKKIDKKFLGSVLILSIAGFSIFISASLGILTKNEDIFKKIVINQLLFGLVLGITAMSVVSYIPYKYWKKYSIIIFIFSVLLNLLIFVPGLGLRHGGALRWIGISGFSFQPSEVLKIGYLMVLAYFFSIAKDDSKYYKYKVIPLFVFTAIVGSILLAQPDNDTFIMTAFAGVCMFFISGARLRDILGIFLIGLIFLVGIFYTKPYIRDRVLTYFNPAQNSLSSGYQIQQSLIAIGSGGILGKGFGQSTQKFGFLPEPTGDSIFAVAGEEFGFAGSVAILFCFLFFALRGLKIASETEDSFGRLLCIGIVILIISGSFINVASMLSLLPLAGTPLLFISHGGSALFLALAEVGIILNISRYRKEKNN